MSAWKSWKVLAVVAGVGLAAGLTLAQQGPPGGFGGRFDPQQFRQRMMERMREMLGASEEEWTVIGPRLEKVMDLSRQVRGGGMGALFWRGQRGGPRPGGPQMTQREPTALEKAAEALQGALDDPDATPAQIKEQLTAYRKAREQARQELAKAQEQLREVLTLQQEARLVLMGLLD